MTKVTKEGMKRDAGDAPQGTPLILRRGITKDQFMPDGEPSTTDKTGTWSDCDQD